MFDSFEEFYKEIGPRPPKTTLDRIRVDGNYEPGNVRWVSQSVQVSNRRPYNHKKRFGKGYAFHSASGKWIVQMHYNGKHNYFGLYPTEEEAQAKVLEVRKNFAKEKDESIAGSGGTVASTEGEEGHNTSRFDPLTD